jgi:hypothetical protein
VIGDIDANRGITDAPVGIGHAGDSAERDNVNGAVACPQSNSADREVLDPSCKTGDRDHVHCVLKQQEQAGNEILHKILRAEAYRDADDACASAATFLRPPKRTSRRREL